MVAAFEHSRARTAELGSPDRNQALLAPRSSGVGLERPNRLCHGSSCNYEAEWKLQTSVPLRTRWVRDFAGTGADDKRRVGSGEGGSGVRVWPGESWVSQPTGVREQGRCDVGLREVVTPGVLCTVWGAALPVQSTGVRPWSCRSDGTVVPFPEPDQEHVECAEGPGGIGRRTPSRHHPPPTRNLP